MLEPGRSNVCLACGNAQSDDSDKGCRPFTSAGTMGFDASPAAGRTLEAQEHEKLLGLLKGGRDRQDLGESNSACAIRYIVVVLLALSYFVVSSWLIVLNKTILKDLNFAYPIFLSGIGQLFSAVTAFVACKVLGLAEVKHGTVSRRLFLTSIAPVGLFSALTLTCGNWVYMYLTVALIQMLKAATPVFVMLALFLARLDRPTPHLLASVALIVTGSAGASFGDVNLSITGLLLMLAAEAFEAVRMVLVQVLLKGHAFSPLEGQMYFGSAAVVCMGMLWAVLELPRMWASGAWAIVRAHPAYFLCSGTLGFVVSLVSLNIIKQTSSLTIKVLSTSRNAGLVLLSALVLGEKVSRSQIFGYAISLAGFAWYTVLRR